MVSQRLHQAPVQRVTQLMTRAIAMLPMDNAALAGLLVEEAADNPCLKVELPLPRPDPPAFRRFSHRPNTAAATPIEDLPDQADGLYAHAMGQIGLMIRDTAEMPVAMVLVEALEPSGWLGIDLSEAAERAGCSLAIAQRTLAHLQQMEPTGLFARSLAECLALQLADAGALSVPMQRLLEHLPALARGELPFLMTHCDVDAAQLGAMVARLRRLDPKPGAHFDSAPDLRRAPDLIAARDTDGRWHVELNDATAPGISVDALARPDHPAALATARWLRRTVSRRNRLVLEVTSHVLTVQHAFLDHGPAALVPLTCAEVGAALGYHETTIGRIRTGLLIQTPRAVLPLHAFFGRGGVRNSAGGRVPRAALTQMIAALIAEAADGAALTDSAIAEALARRGIRVARRTVANHRRQAGFPAAARRAGKREQHK